MNYNNPTFWFLFLAVFAPYWRLSHRRQNDLLLVASYVFYGFWDYRFLFLILISTVIDFIGGLGVAGVRLSRRRLAGLGALLLVGALALCSGVQYGALWANGRVNLAALPHRLRDFAVPLVVTVISLLYGALLPSLYSARRRRELFLAISMVANLGILGFFKYCDFFLHGLQQLLAFAGVHASPSVLGIILPAGI